MTRALRVVLLAAAVAACSGAWTGARAALADSRAIALRH
jgi:hypothetical protein